MKKQEKLERYTRMYMEQNKNMSREEALEKAKTLIPYKQNNYLSIQDLKIKYDYPNMDGEYPDWLTPEQHYKVCKKVVTQKFKYDKFKWLYDEPQELMSELYIYTRVRLNKIHSLQQLELSMVNRCKNLLREAAKNTTQKRNEFEEGVPNEQYWERLNGQTYIAMSINEESFKEDDLPQEKETMMENKKSAEDNNEWLIKDTILSIKSEKERNILITVGYLKAGMDCLEEEFRDILKHNTVEQNKELYKIMLGIFTTSELDIQKELGNITGRQMRKLRETNNIKLEDILNVFTYNEPVENFQNFVGQLLVN